MYANGKIMAQTYLNKGKTEGNKHIGKFQSAVSEVSQKIQLQQAKIAKDATETQNGIDENVGLSIVLNIIFGISILGMGILIFFIISKYVQKPIRKVTTRLVHWHLKSYSGSIIPEVRTKDEDGCYPWHVMSYPIHMKEMMSTLNATSDEMEQSAASMNSRTEEINLNVKDIADAMQVLQIPLVSRLLILNVHRKKFGVLEDIATRSEEASKILADASSDIAVVSPGRRRCCK